MSKKARRQKTQKTKQSKPSETKKEKKRKLPSLKETEAYIKKHKLEIMDPLSDYGFKRLLASERNKDILMHLLNVFISDDTGIITDVTYKSTEMLGVRKEDKYVRYDLYCKNQDGRHFIVEMQNGKQSNYADRLRVYTSLATVRNMDKDDKYYERVPKIYSFNIMSYNMPEFKGKKRFFSKIYHKDDDNDIFTKNIVYYFVELSKFAAQLETLDMSDERNLILYMFTNVVYLQEEEINNLTPMQMRFYEECQISNFTNMEKQDYVKSLMDYPSVHEMVECERKEAKEEGILIGIQMGIEQGIQQGREQGREEGREERTLQLARNMLAEDLDSAMVAKISGLTEADVLALMKE
ncbi:MAG: Rpn family recombination-promoting nuclease/putative transposase [Bacteroidales bacterium]|nr:Rpn family recombination-promoting nuclease/putative transposase [Bacteroidales bacterium]